MVELAIALFVMIQLSWVGVFYALALGLHYVVTCLARRWVQWPVLAVLALVPLLSTSLGTPWHGVEIRSSDCS
jgi:hypothetical protein